MPLCLPGEMMAKQKTVLIVNLHSVTEETGSNPCKPLLSAHVFGALADNGFAWITRMTWHGLSDGVLRTKIFRILFWKV